MSAQITPNTEAIYQETSTKIEWQYFDEQCKPVHQSMVIYKDKPLIEIYPYSYSQQRGITRKKIKSITLDGWNNLGEVPSSIKAAKTVRVTVGAFKPLMNFILQKFPEIETIKIVKNGQSRFSKKNVTFQIGDLDKALKAVGKEVRMYEIRRKTAISNALADITEKVEPRTTSLSKGGIAHFLSFYGSEIHVSEEDVNSILSVLSLSPSSNISVTENFIQTKDKINVAYLDDVIEKFEGLLQVKSDNEKDWQAFFEKHGWILANLFPFQVILRGREAYVGGKTIENKEGRVVDFLFQNGFRDNYALLEIKTHNATLLKPTPYRQPDVYSIHESLAGAIGQCLDQKNTFLTDMGQKYKSLDPKIVLVVGMKKRLNEQQANCFELIRANQKHIDIVTFDELLAKVKGLQDVLKLKK
ncbi:MAG TPA: Shedu immune nuclease family protein [Gallionella sp.]|nr:Shedu immune nuclease family protein [Gallionella sp.]